MYQGLDSLNQDFHETVKPTLLVEPGGVEPPSKQGHTEVSTCLSRD